ncbi:MAG: hypothetical protein ACR2KK_16720 [Acidimicrobiales bacterium]
MATIVQPVLAEVTQAGDIVVFAFVLGLVLVVGLALLGLDTLVGRHRRKR